MNRRFAILLALGLLLGSSSLAVASDHFVGIWGIPSSENLNVLSGAGLDTIMFSSAPKQIEKVADLPLRKIGSLGINPTFIESANYNRSLIEQTIDKRFKSLDSLPDIYGYCLLGDAQRWMEGYAQYAIDSRGLSVDKQPYPFIVLEDTLLLDSKELLSAIGAFAPDANLMTYYYPLMRRWVGFDGILRAQLQASNKIHTNDTGGAYVVTQAHRQDWYRGATEIADWLTGKPSLYPDGQVVRMLFYYALATGADGYLFYDAGGGSLSGEIGEERTRAIAQTLLETKPLRNKIGTELKLGQYVERETGKVFGTILKGDAYDLIFFFSADQLTALTHPSTQTVKKPLWQLINAKARGYKKVYEYTPFGLTPRSATARVRLTQEKPLILVGVKSEIDQASFALSEDDRVKYRDNLSARAMVLKNNMQGYTNDPLPDVPSPADNVAQDCAAYLTYIQGLDELKRTEWLALGLPIDGDILLVLDSMGLLTGKMLEGQVLNFYFR